MFGWTVFHSSYDGKSDKKLDVRKTTIQQEKDRGRDTRVIKKVAMPCKPPICMKRPCSKMTSESEKQNNSCDPIN